LGGCGGRPIGCARRGMVGVGEGSCSSDLTDCGGEVREEGWVEKFALGEIGFAGGDGDERKPLSDWRSDWKCCEKCLDTATSGAVSEALWQSSFSR
jgi:hypothetical protein